MAGCNLRRCSLVAAQGLRKFCRRNVFDECKSSNILRRLSSGLKRLPTLQRTSETLVNFYQTTRRYNPEDSYLRTHRRENLKSYQAIYNLHQRAFERIWGGGVGWTRRGETVGQDLDELSADAKMQARL
jgi:hypothetical protein